jgi:phosphatidate phosphatase LPIN
MMPEGAVLISPDRSGKSIYREMIIKQPHIFKISCLVSIKNLFQPNQLPFFAGFGNRPTDTITYRVLGVSNDKIFIINKKGVIK